MASHLKLQGVIPPMISPLNLDRSIDIDGLERLVKHMLDGGVAGLFLFGSSGEGPWLTSEQIEIILSTTKMIVQRKIPLLAGVLEPSTSKVIQAIHHIESIGGVDAVVVTTPYYFGTDADDQIEHIQTIAQQSTLPIILYNIPPTTHHILAASTVKRLLGISNIIGIKDSAGDMAEFEKLLQLKKIRPDFAVLQGAEAHAAQSLMAGADGIVPGLGNLVPHLFATLLQDVQSQNKDAAIEKQDTVNTLGQLHQPDYWLKCLKYGAALLGFGSGTTVSHCNDLSSATKETIEGYVAPYLPPTKDT